MNFNIFVSRHSWKKFKYILRHVFSLFDLKNVASIMKGFLAFAFFHSFLHGLIGCAGGIKKKRKKEKKTLEIEGDDLLSQKHFCQKARPQALLK
jgi:hypothetical protein